MPPSQHLSRLLSTLPCLPSDLWLVSSEGYSLPSHSLLLCLHSPSLRHLLSSLPSPNCLSLPLPALTLSSLLSLLTSGSCSSSVNFNPTLVIEAADMLGINLEDIQIKTSKMDKEECSDFLDNPDKVKAEPEEESWPLEIYEQNNHEFTSEKISVVVVEKNVDINSLLDKSTGIYHCNECKYDTQIIHKIKQHQKTIHQRKYKCEHCEYETKCKYHVQLHMESKHTGVRYDCDQCNFQTAHKKNVDRHIESKHATDKKNKKYKCDMCDFKTFVKINLRAHGRKAHDKYIREGYYKMAQLKKKIKD